MRRVYPLLLAVLLVAVPAGLAQSATGIPDGYAASTRRDLAAGVEHTVLTRPDPASLANVARIAPGAPVALRAVSSDNRIVHGGAAMETPSSMCRRMHCIAAVNGDYHDLRTNEPLGGVVSGGRMLRSPTGGRPQFTVTKTGAYRGGPMDWSAALRTSDGASIRIDGINTTSHPADAIVLYTPDWGLATGATDATEMVLHTTEPLGTLGRTSPVEIGSTGWSGTSGIPVDGAILTGFGAGADTLARLSNTISQGRLTPAATVTVTSSVNAAESLAGNPMLLSGGLAVYPPADDGFTKNRNPRTAIGWNASGEIFLVTVDGRQTASRGMSIPDLAGFMRSIGATEAMNLDGGGGTTFVVDGVVTNNPVDDGSVGMERPAPSALLIVAANAPPTPGPTPGGGPAPGSSTAKNQPPFAAASKTEVGYWMVSAEGSVYAFGDARPWGNATPWLAPFPAVDLEPTRTTQGYWIVDSAGRVFGFGDARHLGNVDPAVLAPDERVTSLSATPSGFGYWIFTSRGRVLRFGDAPFLGDMTATKLNGAVLDSIPTPSGRGYYMVASDGGIFAFGDARFYGSMGATKLNAPVQSLVPDPDGRGYWLVASDGGVFAFDSAFRGSMGAQRLSGPVTGMVPFGNGYLMVGEDGGIFNFSDKEFFGSLGNDPPPSPIVSVGAFARTVLQSN